MTTTRPTDAGCGAAQFPILQVVPPGNDVSAGDFPKLIRPLDASELNKILKGIFIGTLRLQIVDVGEPSISSGTLARRRKPAVRKTA
jgi:hypothetical protein